MNEAMVTCDSRLSASLGEAGGTNRRIRGEKAKGENVYKKDISGLSPIYVKTSGYILSAI